ncbi:MAG TPA: hypothetical protein VGB76_20630 [Pyrinomonadaceae bacterium]|jgi:hypothetical protein
MLTKNQKITRLLSILLVFCITPLYVNAELLSVKANAELASAQTDSGGRLRTTGNRQIDVNGNPAPSGTTILSGASLSTSEGTGATVDLPGLGRVNMSPNSRLSINYTASSVDVTVTSGCATLDLTNANANGSITAPRGEATRTSANQRHLDVCYTDGAAAPIVNQGAAAAAGAGAAGGAVAGAATATGAAVSGGLFGLGVPATVALGVASAAFAAGGVYAVTRTPCRRGANLSPGVPRGRNDECRE